MKGFFRKGSELEHELRAARPSPSDDLVSRIEALVREARPAYRRASLRVAVPVAVTVAMVSALAAVGGVGYAANGVVHAAKTVAKVFVPAKQTKPIVVSGINSGSDQYRPGYGYGDENHNHTGPPGLKKQGGEFAPPIQAVKKGKTAFVSTSFTIDEQAHIVFSVIDLATGKKLLITQKKSKFGGALKGVQAKNINYLVLVPRKIPIRLAVPANLLAPGAKYAIEIRAKDPDGNKSKTRIAFTG